MKSTPRISNNLKKRECYAILHYLQKKGWKSIYAYQGFDKSVDYDAYSLKKKNTYIHLAWHYKFKGAMLAPSALYSVLSKQLNIQFEFGRSPLLRTGIVRKIDIETHF